MAKAIEWSPTRIDVANYCLMRYHLRYIEKAESLKLSAYLKGSLLHHLIENLWDDLGKKYNNAEEFAKHAQGMWDSYCIRAENSDQKVSWRFPEERWTIKRDLEGICLALFPVLIEEGPPIFRELEFKFGIPGKTFKVRVDEIRKTNGIIVIRDYKSGKPYMGEMKLKYDPQLTVYNAGLKALLEQNDKIARRLGFDGRNVFVEDSFVNPDFLHQFFMVEGPFSNKRREHENKASLPYIHQSTRTNEHFLEVVNMIDGVQNAVSSGRVYPERGRKCDDCDMKRACEAKLKQVGKGQFAVKDQLSLDFAIPFFAQTPEQQKAINGKDKTQKRLPLRYPKTPPVQIITPLS